MKHPREQTVKKIALITAWLVDTPEAYKGKTNEDIEKEILEEISLIPYIARIERAGENYYSKVTIGHETIEQSPPVAQRLAFKDWWSGGIDSYVDVLYPRLQLMKRLL